MIDSATSFTEAVDGYVGKLAPRRIVGSSAAHGDDGAWEIRAADLEAPYSSAGTRYLRLLYFMTIFPNDPMAWFGSNRGLSFTRGGGAVLDPDLKPEWHHFFPKAFMKSKNVTDA